MLAVMDDAPDLREFDVYPFPLRVAVHWTDDGLDVELVVVTAVDESGYSSVPIASHVVPYSREDRRDEAPGSADVSAAVSGALTIFAEKLSRVLRDA
jgi:hypothetical protein